MHHRLLLAFALLCTAVQGTWAQNAEVKFTVRSWDETENKLKVEESTITDYIEVPLNYNSSEWYGLGGKENKDYYYVVKGNAKFDVPLNVFGRVHLILCDNITLTCNNGILVQKQDDNDPHLIIHSHITNDAEYTKMGSLVVTNSNKNWAAIGSSEAHDCGKITIQGGRVVATGAKYGAGIGAGACTSDVATKVGDITIYGGYVVATGGDSGAGIGGGGSYDDDQYSDGGNFTMYGGIVSTTGGEDAAGIGGGGGYHWLHDNFCSGGNGGKVYIYGGYLIAKGGINGAGIGSGTSGIKVYRSNNAGEVHIYGGKVEAYGGGDAAGVGGGYNAGGGKVYVRGGELYGKGGANGAGIGSGNDEYHETGAEIINGTFFGLNGGILEVSGGTVKGEGKGLGAGIGGGVRGAGSFVTITGGIVEASTEKFYNVIYLSDEDPAAFGPGALVCKYSYQHNNTDKSLLRGSLSIPDNFMVTTGKKKEKDMDGVLPAANRISYCFERQYARIEACPHTVQNDDASLLNTYTIKDADTHYSHCRYCNYTETEAHEFNTNGICVCGATKSGLSVVTINVYTGTDDSTYTCQTDKVAENINYVLPKPADIEGFRFMGYLEAKTAPKTIEMLDAEFTQLLDAGQTVTPTADVSYYARYRYTYTEKWTWAEDYSSATLKISWIKNGATFEPAANSIKYYDDSKDPTADSEGYYRKIAQWEYEPESGYKYTFSDAINITRLYELSLADGSDNTDVINNNNGSEVNTLTLTERTLFKDGGWNTLCLPFDVSDGNETDNVSFTGTPLEGADVRTLESSKFDSSTGVLTLNFTSVNKIEAGKPYIVKWNSGTDITPPAFKNVNLSVKDAEFIESNYVGFMGCFSPVSLEANDKTVLYLGADNMLYYPSADMTIGSCRAYFKLKGLTAGDISKKIKAFVLNFGEESESNGISTIHPDAVPSDGWYTLDGRRLFDAPLLPGLYIHNGRKVLIK